MATIHVDGKALEVDGADNLLQACLSLGLDIPYFCWHPALGSVGACRQCAVKQYTDENDTRGRIVMSCMTPATDNTWISIEDEESKAFRTLLDLLNHTNKNAHGRKDKATRTARHLAGGLWYLMYMMCGAAETASSWRPQ